MNRRWALATLAVTIACGTDSAVPDPAGVVDAEAGQEKLVRETWLRIHELVNEDRLTDSATFNEVKETFAEDFMVLGGGQSRHGRQELFERYWPLFQNNRVEFRDIEVKHLEVSGDLAFVLSSYEEAILPRDGSDGRVGPETMLHILRRGPDGRWRILVESQTPS